MLDCYGMLEGTEGSLLPSLCASHLYPRSKYTPGAFPLTRLHFNVDGGTWQVASMQADQRLQSKCRINCFKSLLREVNEWIKRLPLFSSMLSPLLWVSGVLTVMWAHLEPCACQPPIVFWTVLTKFNKYHEPIFHCIFEALTQQNWRKDTICAFLRWCLGLLDKPLFDFTAFIWIRIILLHLYLFSSCMHLGPS